MSSIDARHAIFPVRTCTSFRGDDGFAVHAWNDHSRAWQPVGTWCATEIEAQIERDQILDLLDLEAA